jgi:GNAT superfamily N-acetyltransferase
VIIEEETEILVRRATLAEAATLAEFNMAMAGETEARVLDRDTLTAGVHHLFHDEQRGFYLVAELSNQVRGALLITYEWSDWRNGLFWWIQSVYVDPQARRQGVFTALYRQVKQMAQDDSSVCGLRLYMEQNNATARSVYTGVGMTETPYQVYEELF